MTKYSSTKIGNVEVGPSMPKVVCNVGRVECAIEGVKQGADIIEARCDLINPPNVEHISTQVKDIRKAIGEIPLIGTIRKTVDGGDWYRFSKSDEERYPIFEEIAPFLDAIDIEYNSAVRDSVVQLCRKQGLSVILSYHNFKNTPNELEIMSMLEKMTQEDSDILKVACLACDKADFDKMFLILQKYLSGDANTKPLTIIPMGYYGRPGRYMFPWFGSCLTYGCVTEEKAPSQPYVSELVDSLSSARKMSDFPISFTERGYQALKKINQDLALVA